MRSVGKLIDWYNANEDTLPSWTRISRVIYATLLWNYMVVELLEDLVGELYEFKYMYKQGLLMTAILFTIGAKHTFEDVEIDD